MTDSLNRLTDFDLCLALAQKAINSQMQFAWKAWKRRKQLSEAISIFPKKEDGTPSKYGLTAELAPLEIDLNVDDGKLGQVKVKLTLKSGSVHYYDEDKETADDLFFTNWSVSFLTDLGKKPVDLKTLALIDPDAHKAARGTIEDSGLTEDVFSIEYLFMKLTEVDLMLADNKNICFPAVVSSSARNKTLSCLNLLLQGDMSDYMLGTVVRRNTSAPAPTFAMTDFVFDVHANKNAAEASSLSYLGMLSGRSLPADINAARIKLNDDWFGPEMIDGTKGLVSGVLAIRKEVFLDNYLMPMFRSVLKTDPAAEGLKRSFNFEDSSSHTSRDLVDRKVVQTRSSSLGIAIVPGSNRLEISGGVEAAFTYTEHTLGPLGTETAKLEAAGKSSLTGSVTLTAKGETKDFEVNTVLNYGFSDFQQTKNDASGFGVVENGVSWIPKLLGITHGTLLEMLGSTVKDNVGLLTRALQTALGSISVNLSQHHFIPPGGGVFTFQNLRFSDQTGDLLLDVIYQAP